MDRITKHFLRYVGQTSPAPMGIVVERADGIYLYTPEGKRFIDLISGVSVSNVGHNNAVVTEAVCKQAKTYMHLMVYGEIIQSPQVDYARLIANYLPAQIDCLYFVNSGSEAVEGALKLAKRVTGRREILAFDHAYHGSTHGALSVMGSDFFKTAFYPLLPEVAFMAFNKEEDLSRITEATAAVIVEPIQGEAGFRIGTIDFLTALRRRCTEMGALLIFDEIQSGFGRTGKMFAWEYLGVQPDIVCMAKAMGGGMPLGGFAARYEMMQQLTFAPPLGHITTFGGHPVCCAAGHAAMQYIIDEQLMEQVEAKKNHFIERLSAIPCIGQIRAAGLMIAVDFFDSDLQAKCIAACVEKGLMTEGFLFCDTAMRIAPPLTITHQQIDEVCDIIQNVLLS